MKAFTTWMPDQFPVTLAMYESNYPPRAIPRPRNTKRDGATLVMHGIVSGWLDKWSAEKLSSLIDRGANTCRTRVMHGGKRVCGANCSVTDCTIPVSVCMRERNG